MVFTHWQSGEPNHFGGAEHCVEMYGNFQAGFWNDAGCNGDKSYICEKEEGRRPDLATNDGSKCYPNYSLVCVPC